MVAAVRPDRPQGHGIAWEALCASHDPIEDWVKDGLTMVKIGDLLARHGVIVPQRTRDRRAIAGQSSVVVPGGADQVSEHFGVAGIGFGDSLI